MLSFEQFPKINGRIHIYKTGRINLGNGIVINSGARYNPIGGDTRTNLSVAADAVLEIGDHSGISNCTIVCQNQIKIGQYVNIGGSVKIYDTDFHALDFEKRKSKKSDIGNTKPILIKDHAFIGAHSIILKGVTIGENAIVGAGSVVTKSIPDNEIWGGNPARFIKDV